MNFASLEYGAFIIVVFCCYWALQKRSQNLFLMLSSYGFYACWDWRFLSLIILSTGVDYFVGLKIHRSEQKTKRQIWLSISLLFNLGLLFYFKYANFFIESFMGMLHSAGVSSPSTTTLNIILPVGISFYTFQSLSYSFDIYRKQLTPCRSLIDFAAFVAFFPQLVAGPIVRAKEFLHQLSEPRRFQWPQFEMGVQRFVWGLFKKAVIADNIGIALVDPVFASPELYNTASLWLAVIGYAIQIYADFSGYTCMAIGSALCLGFILPENFKYPYLARNFSDFWQRWHMTMSRFFRDYVYIPLGGNRCSAQRNIVNLILTTLVSGLWHGAAWHFVLWGGLHGIMVAAQRWLSTLFSTPNWLNTLIKLIGFHLALLTTWVLFRAENMETASVFYSGMLTTQGELIIPLSPWILYGFIFLIADHGYGYLQAKRERKTPTNQPTLYALLSDKWKALAILALIIGIFHGMPAIENPFIYFQF